MFADLGNRFFDVVAHHPVGPRAADVQHKAVEHGLALHGVCDFGVELYGVVLTRFISHAGNRAGVGRSHDLEAGRQLGDLVAVAHPDLEHAVAFGRGEVCNVFQQLGMAACTHLGITELPRGPALDLAAELLRHGLHAVANAQHGNAQVKHGLRCPVCAFLVHAGMAAGKNDAFEHAVFGVLTNPFVTHIAGMHLTKNMRLAHSSGDELGDLRAEVEDQDFLVLHDGRLRADSEKRGLQTQHRPRNWLCQAAGGTAPSGGSAVHEVTSVGAFQTSVGALSQRGS